MKFVKAQTITFLVLITLILSGCSLFQAKIKEDFKRDDLNPVVVDSLEQFTNDAYKMNPEYTNDLVIALIRQNTLNVETAKENVKILFHLLSIRNRDYFDENLILSRLDSKQQKDYRREFPTGLPAQHTIDDYVQSHPLFQDTLTCKVGEVDAHWAYFSATGDTKAIEKMRRSYYVPGIPCCFSCLEWSIPSRAMQNKDVYDKLIEMRDNRCAKAKDPELCISYEERFIPPVSECNWRYSEMFKF